MSNNRKFYINGAWVDPISPRTFDVINPATEEVAGTISMGSAADVDLAVKAARAAFPRYSQTTKAERIDLLRQIVSVYEKRYDDMAMAAQLKIRLRRKRGRSPKRNGAKYWSKLLNGTTAAILHGSP